MNSNINERIKKDFEKSLAFIDTKEDLEYDARMIMYRFLSEIERIADKKGLNRKELAALIGTSPSYLTQLFRGNKLINMETIAKFQSVFNITFDIKAISNNVEKVSNDQNINKLNDTQNNIGLTA
jgi:ribosome-binding protein aMBF1 (putative translation factor)